MEAKAAQSKAASDDSVSPPERRTQALDERLDPETRVPGGSLQLYVGGLVLLLVGGSALFIRLYRYLSLHITADSLRSPLQAVQRHAKLFVLLHVAYFGIMILSIETTAVVPRLQHTLLTRVRHEIHGGRGPLGVAGSAYESGNIPLAAGATLVLNFVIGSVLSITVPSLVVPGAGTLLAAIRAAMWGVLLAPTYAAISSAMLPHSFTLLIEGEAYILATFFGLMVPIYLCRPEEGPTVGARYVDALLLNLKGSLWVLVVLAVSAVYEATEVIIMKGS